MRDHRDVCGAGLLLDHYKVEVSAGFISTVTDCPGSNLPVAPGRSNRPKSDVCIAPLRENLWEVAEGFDAP